MAELNQNTESGRPKKIRSRKLTSRVDLTAMVDLAFLLITFFMLTTTLSEPKSMALTMPDKHGTPSPVDENRTLTILIGANDKAKCFMGKSESASPKAFTVGTRELRHEIAARQKQAQAYCNSIGKPGKGLIVLIKPHKDSNYGNLVDVLDEMAIGGIETYAIADIDQAEAGMLAMK